jgi:Flp pilus assembly protein TadG
MRRRPLSLLAGDRSGGAAVEFGLVIGPFLLLLFGVIEFGRMLWTANAMQETAIAGARCMGILNASCAASGAYSSTNTTSYIETTSSSWGVPLTSTNITLNNAATCAGVSGFSQVTISYTFQTAVPFITSLASNPLTATACFPNQPS